MGNWIEHWLAPVFAAANHKLGFAHGGEAPIQNTEYALMSISVGVATLGIVLATSLYRRASTRPAEFAERFKALYNLLWRKYFIDELYYGVVFATLAKLSRAVLWQNVENKVVDGAVNGSATGVGIVSGFASRLQSGIAQNYALVMLLGIVAVMAWLLLG
jgi:NADH-quinone oxidoreductase subunit L